MAYNPAYYMNGWGGNTYPNYMTQNPQPVSYGGTPQPMTPVQDSQEMKWVDGEVGAKAFQMPAGWPANKPIPLWDSTDTVIYLKSWSQMGAPNPLQKLKYEIQEQPLMLPGQSGAESQQYAMKEDFEQLRNEIREMKEALMNRNAPKTNQNGSQNGNRGENR